MKRKEGNKTLTLAASTVQPLTAREKHVTNKGFYRLQPLGRRNNPIITKAYKLSNEDRPILSHVTDPREFVFQRL